MWFVGVLVNASSTSASSPALRTSPAETNLKDGWAAGDGPEDGHHRHDLLLTAAGEAGSNGLNASWELPAIRMTASEMRDDWEPLPISSPVAADWLIEKMDYFDQNAP